MFGCSQLSSECEEFAAYNTDSSSSTGSSSDDGNGIIAAAVPASTIKTMHKSMNAGIGSITLLLRCFLPHFILHPFSFIVMTIPPCIPSVGFILPAEHIGILPNAYIHRVFKKSPARKRAKLF